jgi:hypothetical protein
MIKGKAPLIAKYFAISSATYVVSMRMHRFLFNPDYRFYYLGMLFLNVLFKLLIAYPCITERAGESDAGLVRIRFIHPKWFGRFHRKSS